MRSAQRIFWLALAAFMAYCSLLVVLFNTLVHLNIFPTNRLGLLASSLALIGAVASLRLAFVSHPTTRQVLSRELPLSCYLGGLLFYALLPGHQPLLLAAGFALFSLLVPLWEYKP